MIEPTDEMVQLIYERINVVVHDDSGIREGLAAVLAIVARKHQQAARTLAADLRRISDSSGQSAMATPPECMREHDFHRGRASAFARAAEIAEVALLGSELP